MVIYGISNNHLVIGIIGKRAWTGRNFRVDPGFKAAMSRKRIAVGQAQGQLFALKLAEKLAREACASVDSIPPDV